MADTRSIYEPTPLRHTTGALALLGLVWFISVIVLASPLVLTLPFKILFLGIPVGLSVLVTLTRPLLGFRVWALGLALLATQTGFQLDVGPIRTSALEVAIIFLLLIFTFVKQKGSELAFTYIAGQRFFALFAAFSVIMLAFSLILGTPVANALPQFKGFLLYPLMAYLLATGLTSQRNLSRLSVALISWYSLLAFAGLFQFSGHVAQSGAIFQSDAGYAPQNIFGVTLVSTSLFLLGILQNQRVRKWRYAGYFVAILLIVGAMTSLSRTAALTFIGGTVFLLGFGRKQRPQLLVLAAVVVFILLAWLPEPALEARLLQLTDSSTARRSFYLLSGLQAWKARLLTGWGWGQGFWSTAAQASTLSEVWQRLLEGGHALVPSGDMPWYHNDYLNLAVQTGVIGVSLYIAFWHRVFVHTLRHLKQHQTGTMAGYTIGSGAALFAFLLSGLFEHTLWRPDSAGMIGLWLGILVAAIHLNDTDLADAEK